MYTWAPAFATAHTLMHAYTRPQVFPSAFGLDRSAAPSVCRIRRPRLPQGPHTHKRKQKHTHTHTHTRTHAHTHTHIDHQKTPMPRRGRVLWSGTSERPSRMPTKRNKPAHYGPQVVFSPKSQRWRAGGGVDRGVPGHACG